MKTLMHGYDGMGITRNACCLWFSNGVFKSKIRLQPCHILQDFPSLVDAVCTPDTSDESRLLWFYAAPGCQARWINYPSEGKRRLRYENQS